MSKPCYPIGCSGPHSHDLGDESDESHFRTVEDVQVKKGKDMCRGVNQHEEVAREIKLLFESRFGEFSSEDFRQVANLFGFEVLPLKLRPKFDEYYEKLSDEERADLDFMMHM